MKTVITIVSSTNRGKSCLSGLPGMSSVYVYISFPFGFQSGIRPRGNETFYMLNSVEHEILMLISIKISRNSVFFRLR